jgi:hypothetical protein
LSDPFNLETEDFCDPVPSEIPEGAMSEAEYDRLLEAVKMAIEPVPQEQFLSNLPLLANLPLFDEPAEAANDNQQHVKQQHVKQPWPLIPFPEGWYASC